jgi:DNA repair exonuclease SbcCD ATPase subunit
MSNTKIKFKTLTMRNFMSYGNNITIFNFETNGTTLIIGEDLDNTSNGKGGNGCGKTTIINALTYCLFDKPISNISKDNLVNNINNKQMIITLDFSKGNDEYRIERARKMKTGAAGNFVIFKKKGADEEYIDLSRDNKNTNTLIEKVLGISYDLFCQIIIFSATISVISRC